MTYDIGNSSTEEIHVCKDCYADPQNDCFRLYEIQKVLINDKKSLELEGRLSTGSSSSTSGVEGAAIG